MFSGCLVIALVNVHFGKGEERFRLRPTADMLFKMSDGLLWLVQFTQHVGDGRDTKMGPQLDALWGSQMSGKKGIQRVWRFWHLRGCHFGVISGPPDLGTFPEF